MEERDFEHRLTQAETKIVEIEKRQDNLDQLINTVGILADREKRVEDDVKEIKADVKELASKPAKRWEDLVSKVVMSIVAAFVGFLLAKFGL